ncbi:cytochrome P450 [Suillus lakei]|nr:cytochrome P450 [Suillus lakei]
MVQMLDLSISDNAQLVLSAADLLLVGASWIYFPKSEHGPPLPPSPPTWHLLGHFLHLRNSFFTIAGWIDRYGPLITISSGTENIIIIGRYKAVVDIMEKQGGSLADCPRMIAAGEILSGGRAIGFMHTGDRFRRVRGALHSHLQPKVAEVYQPLQMSHARNTVLDILDDPYNFQNHATTYAAASIMKITCGKTTPTSASDPEVREVHRLFERFRTALHPGAYLVDSIPWLKYLPWYGLDLKRQFESTGKLYTNQLNRVKQQLQSDVDVENERLHHLTETEMAFLGGALFGAGSDTTAVAICTVLMAAACFPEEQAKVQAEICTAPTFTDQESLPRFAHRTTEDVIWENYSIPAGTMVFGNHWAISQDPEVYPDPDTFKPQRWTNDQGRMREDLKFFVYRFGRRICPAQHVANRSVFINSLLILWAFQLTLDPTKPLDDLRFMTGAMLNDRPCAIDFKARFPEVNLRRMMQNYPVIA